MLKRDMLVASLLAVVMWATLIFTYVAAFGVIQSLTIRAILAVAFVILGVFNSLGLLSMSRRYKIEREHVYGEDIHHLDQNRKAKQAARGPEVSAA
jgi:membrane protein YdbS with pleckstrin-like domain